MKYIVVYHDTETLASRSRKPRPGETISYRAIKDWDEKENANYDEVVNLAKSKIPVDATKEKELNHVKSNSE